MGSSSCRSPSTNSTRRSRCTRGSLRSRRASPTPTSCASRSSSVSWSVLRTGPRRLSPPSTSSDPGRECSLPPPSATRSPQTSRKPRSLSRRPLTRSMLAPPPPAPPWSPPAPPSRPPETSALAPPSAELALLPELVQSPEQGQHSDQDLSCPPGINQPPSHHLPLYIQTVCAVNM